MGANSAELHHAVGERDEKSLKAAGNELSVIPLDRNRRSQGKKVIEDYFVWRSLGRKHLRCIPRRWRARRRIRCRRPETKFREFRETGSADREERMKNMCLIHRKSICFEWSGGKVCRWLARRRNCDGRPERIFGNFSKKEALTAKNKSKTI